ncbi:MAG: TetR/AcrR family transcriptional regulator [Peptococcaceae bacterium]|nr:TetR/AcrR family transcriptional regulator [Peptococcaceae bacterium]
MAKDNQRIRLTKVLLKDSLREILETSRDIRRVTVKELCARAGINRSTFYKYYGSPTDLLNEIENDWILLTEAHINEAQGTVGQFVLSMLNVINAQADMCRLLCNNQVESHFIRTLIAIPAVNQMIDEAIQPDSCDYPMDYVREYMVNGCCSVIIHWLNKENRESPEEFARVLLGLSHFRDKPV